MNLRELQRDPAAFQQGIYVTTGRGPRRFGDVMADFQRERFAAVNPLLLAVARHETPPIPRVWDERTKGASKDTDWAINLLWLLAFSHRPLRMQVGAFDSEQADEVRLIVKDILRTDGPLNAFARQVIEVQADKIINPRTGSVVEILTTDEYGAHGARIDLLLMNELTHQPSSGFAETLFDNADKMPNALGVVVSNSGHDPSWQLNWKRLFAALPARWLMLEYTEPAPWVSRETLAEAEKRNPVARFQRLWHGVWAPEEGTEALSAADIDAAFVADLRPQSYAQPGFEYTAGLDLGVSRNWSALCVLGVRRAHDGHGQIQLAHLRVWRPRKNQKVDLQQVEDAIRETHDRFNLKCLNYDPWQAMHMASRLQAAGVTVYEKQLHKSYGKVHATQKVPMNEVTSTPKNLQLMATTLIEAFTDRRVELFEDSDLRADLKNFKVEEKQFGYRLVSPQAADGSHGDVGMSFTLALLAASELASKRKFHAGAVTENFGEGGQYLTPMQRAWQRFEMEKQMYQSEQERYARMQDHQQPFREAMQHSYPQRVEQEFAKALQRTFGRSKH